MPSTTLKASNSILNTILAYPGIFNSVQKFLKTDDFHRAQDVLQNSEAFAAC